MTGLVCTRFRAVAPTMILLCGMLGAFPSYAAAQADIVLHAGRATTYGAWQVVDDATAASTKRVWNADLGAAKVNAPSASPTDYFELSFHAESGRAYRIWLRGRADHNAWTNDSVFVQFSGTVDASGAPTFRMGTSTATMVSIEEGSGRGLSGWGWGDNGWNSLGPVVYFETSGPQTLRIQRREDGISIDQVVLSATTYAAAPPGATKNDTTILAEQTGAPALSATEIAFGAGQPAAIGGNWQIFDDSTAAGGKAVGTLNNGAAKAAAAAAAPRDYVDYTFTAEAGRPYRLWLRGRAESDHWANDSVFVQFSGAESLEGAAMARIGTSQAVAVNLEAGSGAGLAGWGWQDNGYGIGVLGPLVMFSATGPQTIRIQTREDGLRIDQIVLSSERYLTVAPGALKNDNTTVIDATATGGTPTPAPTPPAEPPAPAPGTPVRMRVLEWNVHHGVGSDGRYNLERIAEWMAKMQPDIIMLNEVEKYTGWGNEDQPERYRAMLQAKTGRTWYVHFTQEYGRWTSNGKGHVILSVFPFDAVGHMTTTFSDGLRGAGAVSQATITVNGRTINLFVAHLDPYDQAMRLTQAKEVMRYAEGFAEDRIVGGDMNAWPDQTSIAELGKTYADSWTVAAAKGQARVISDVAPQGQTKKGRIDYIYVSRTASNLTVLDMAVIDTRDAAGYMPSDHRPIIATIEVK